MTHKRRSKSEHVARVRVYEDKKQEEFTDSLIIGAITGSTLLGTVLGGDVAGAAIGDLLNGDLFD